MSSPNKNYRWMAKKKLMAVLLAPLLLILFPLMDYKNNSLVIFPGKEIQNHLRATTDRYWKGNSRIIEFSYTEDSLYLEYVLKTGAPTPQVFFSLALGTTTAPLDLAGFQTLRIRIKEATNKRILIYIKTFYPGLSLPESNQTHTLRHNQYNLQLQPDQHVYDIKLDEFLTSSWWYETIKADRNQVSAENFEQVVAFDMVFTSEGSDSILNKPETVIIDSITFRSGLSSGNTIIFWLLILYSGVLLFFLGKFLFFTPGKKFELRKTLRISSYYQEDTRKIKKFIETHYFNEHISTEMVSRELGIPPNRVFAITKREYKLTFKQLINGMRIEEAKRILKETDLKIIDIALKLGYNNVTYFNTLFKNLNGITPSAYRKNAQVK